MRGKHTARVKDMTEGEPLRLIIAFAIPILIGNIFQQIYNTVDTMVVGYELGDSAIAAIGGVTPLYSLIVNFAIGLNNGYGIVVTQRFGAHDKKVMKQSIAGAMVLNAGMTIFLTVLAFVFLQTLMRFMNIPSTIFGDSYSYIVIIYGGMIFTVAYNMFAAILRAVGNSRIPLYFLILGSFLNIILDVTFVMILKMGLSGAAIATVMAQGVAASLCGIYTWKHYRDILPEKESFRVPKKTLSELISAGLAMAMMYSVINVGTVVFQRANNMFGEIYITSYTAARKIIDMTMEPMFTVATAGSTFIGQNWGAKKYDRIKEGLRKIILVDLVWAIFIAVVVYFFGSNIIRFTTGTENTEIIKNAVLSMRLHVSLYTVLGILVCLRNAMQAMGRKIAPVVSSCIELGMKVISACWIIPKLGFLGTCLTEPVTWIFMMIFLVAAYIWQEKSGKLKIRE